ncbi:hypothetical protein VPH35_137489 [Triticum aestivum]
MRVHLPSWLYQIEWDACPSRKLVSAFSWSPVLTEAWAARSSYCCCAGTSKAASRVANLERRMPVTREVTGAGKENFGAALKGLLFLFRPSPRKGNRFLIQ